MSDESFRERMLKRIQNRVPSDWYSISNKSGPVAEVRIYSEIGFWGITAADFVAELDEVTAPEMMVAVNCLGGDVFDGVAIYNALRLHDAHVTTRVDSMAASIASVIVQAGDQRQMVKSSQMMIHEAWGFAVGTASDMRELAGLLDRQTDVIADIYAERAGSYVGEMRSLMEAESWFTDIEAVDASLADEVITPARRELSDKARNQTSVAQTADNAPLPVAEVDGAADTNEVFADTVRASLIAYELEELTA